MLKRFLHKVFSSDIRCVPPLLEKKYYPSIDGLRAMAILTVLFYHVSLGSPYNKWINPSFGVDIFFVLSGFLITTLLLKEKITTGTVSFRNFYIRRVLRIFPVMYLYLFSLIILSRLLGFHLSVLNVITSILYLKNFPTDTTWQTGHFWTLSVEEQFYLFVPLLLIINTSRYLRIILIIFVIVPIIDYFGFHNVGIFQTIPSIHKLTFVFLALLDKGSLYIFCGSLLSILAFKQIIAPDRRDNKFYLSIILFGVACFIHFTTFVPSIPFLSAPAFGVLIGLVIIFNLTENNFFTNVLSSPALIKLGKLSYSLYVWQQLFTVSQPWSGKFKYSNSIILNLIALFIVANCSYYLFEVKFLRLKNRFKGV